MTVYEVFTTPILSKYKATICSKATVFVICSSLFMYITPLLLAYRSYGFWLRSDSYIEQPSVQFKYEFLLLAETDSLDGLLVCSTFDDLNFHLKKESRCPIVKSIDHDVNMDGKIDEINLEIAVQLGNEEEIFAVNLLLLFDYRLSALCHLQMESAALIQHTSPLPGARLDTVSELKLIQRMPLSVLRGTDNRYNNSIIADPLKLQSYHLPSVLKNYSKRNVSTRLENEYQIWQTGRPTGEPFVLSATIQIPEQSIIYQPGFWQIMKWAWLQYFALFIIVSAFTNYIKQWVFSNHVIPIIKMPPPWSKPF